MMTYLILLHLYLIASLVFYHFILRKELQYSYSRIFLLSSLAVSVVLPLLPLHFYSFEAPPTLYGLKLPTLIVRPGSGILSGGAPSSGISLWRLIWAIYGIGIGVGLLRMLLGMYRLGVWSKEGRTHYQKGIRLVFHPGVDTPFSYLRSIYLPVRMQTDSLDMEVVIGHEMAHIRLRHHIDVWIVQFFKMLLWWSPVAYIYEYFLRQLHEFQADYAAIRLSGMDPSSYSKILVDYCSNTLPASMVNSFNQSPLKSRIMMLFKKNLHAKPSNAKYRMSFFLLAGFIIIQGCTGWNGLSGSGKHAAQARSTYDVVFTDTIIMFDTETNKESMRVVKNEIKDIYSKPDTDAGVLGEDGRRLDRAKSSQRILQYIYKHITYPEEAKKAKVEGMVIAKMIISKEGHIAHISIKRSPSKLLSDAVWDVLYEMNSGQSPLKWYPATVGGEAVNSDMYLPIKFKLN